MNDSSEVLDSVQSVPVLCRRLFGIEIDFYDMLELLPVILRKTGSIAIRNYLFKGSIKNHKLDLPCGVYGIKHVCDSKPMSWYNHWLMGEERNYLVNYRVDQSGNLGAYNPDATSINQDSSAAISTYVVNEHVFTAPLGRMINFENDSNKCLHFNFKEKDVDVLYIGMALDEDGYPKLPEKTTEAIAYYMNYIDMRMKFNRRQATGDQWKVAKDEMEQAIAQARTPSFLSQNEIDDILNVLTSSNRKRHNFQHRK